MNSNQIVVIPYYKMIIVFIYNLMKNMQLIPKYTVWSSEIDHPLFFYNISFKIFMNERCYNVPTSNGDV